MIDHILKASLERGWIVTIMYQKGSEITRRDIKVLELDTDSVKAFCYLRNQYRNFEKSKILAASLCKTLPTNNLPLRDTTHFDII